MSTHRHRHPQHHRRPGRFRPTAAPTGPDRPSSILDPRTREELAEMLVDQPFAFLDAASRQLFAAQSDGRGLISLLHASRDTEAVALAAAMNWLAVGRPPAVSVRARLPGWLTDLVAGDVIGAARRREGPNRSHVSYLVEMQLPGNYVGTLQARVDTSTGDRLINTFVTDEPLTQLAAAIRAVGRTHPNAREAYRPIMATTARRALSAALAISDPSPADVEPVNPWPALRPLVSFVLQNFGDGDPHEERLG